MAECILCTVEFVVEDIPAVEFSVQDEEDILFELGDPAIHIIDIPVYEGDYTVTPTQEQQVLETDDLRMLGNVVIEPIPQNYGLITYNGRIITVS